MLHKVYLTLAVLLSLSYNPYSSFQRADANAQDSSKVITLSFVGDLMCHMPQYKSAMVSADSFDFAPVFENVIGEFKKSDCLFGNLETVFAGADKNYSGYPLFNSPDDYVKSLRTVGFDFLFTSNNHCIDRGEYGILRTIQQINKCGIKSTGTFSSQRDKDSIRIINIKGINAALLGYTKDLNGNASPKNKMYLVNIIDTAQIRIDIAKARTYSPDLVIVYMHIGEEDQRTENKHQREAVSAVVNAGADIIICSHPHVLQPVEYFKTNNTKLDSGIVAYSLGNFFSNQQWRYSDAGVILDLQIEKNLSSGKLKLKNVNAVPTWVFKGIVKNKMRYYILPSAKYGDTTLTYLGNSQKAKMKEAYYDSKKVLQSRGKIFINGEL